MKHKQSIARRVTINFAAIQGGYWTSTVPYLIFAAVFLQYRGLTNSQVGFTLSAAAIGAIIIQILVSDFSDKNPMIPLKRIIAGMYVVMLCVSTALSFVPYPVAFVMVAFIIGETCVYSTNSLISALFMQLQNTGLNINYGIPRGVGSIAFAILAFYLGGVVEKYSPEVLFTIQIGLSLLALIFILVLPKPEDISGKHPDQIENEGENKSILEMLKGNPTFVMLMISMAFAFTGQSFFAFSINILRNVGGNTANLGVVSFINSASELMPMLFSFWLLKKFGSKKLLIVSIIAFFLKTLSISIATSINWIYIGMLTSIFANGIFFFASVYFINEIVKPNERTRGQALIGLCAFGGIGTVIGSTVNGLLLDNFGLNAMMVFCVACSFLGVVFMLITSHLHDKHFGKNEPTIEQPQKLAGLYQPEG